MHLVWERQTFTTSPAISKSLDAALQASDLGKEDIDLFDFYSFVPSSIFFPRTNSQLAKLTYPPSKKSCFPIVPKLARQHLSLPKTTPLTLLGGLTSFGGAGNNYSMHALTEMTRQLRSKKGERTTGLILANGGVLTYQHAVCLSSSPRKDGSPYPSANPLPAGPPPLESSPAIKAEAEGLATIEVRLTIP